MNAVSLSAAELKAACSLSLVFFLRMLSLFMLLPVLALAEDSYPNASPQLLGMALGIYGLTQAGLQIPFGILSDRYGRKRIITIGLLIFIAGSLIAALSDSVYGLIIGRALQGAGAIAAAIMALAADLTSEQSRTRVMAIIGMSIGLAFCFAFVLGPFLYTRIGLDGLFYVGAILGCSAIIILLIIVPTPTTKPKNHHAIGLAQLQSVLIDKKLLQLNYSIFTSHLILMANFVVIPIALRDFVELPATMHWQVYLTVLFISLFIMLPFIIFSERLKKIKLFFIASVLLILCSQLGLLFLHSTLIQLGLFLILFFGAFNYLEAFLPSAISKNVAPENKGAALGVYSTSQFIGIFIGGLSGGILHQHLGIHAVLLFCLCVSLLWLLITFFFLKTHND